MTSPTCTVVTVTEPCVVDDMPDEVYHADPVAGGSLSSSGARKLLPPSCPAKFAHERNNPPTSTDSFDLGKAAHRLILGAGADITVVEAPDWRTKAARQARDDAYAAGRVPLLAADHDRARAMADTVRAHRIAGALLRDGTPERSLFWVDPDTGVWCRARHDWQTTRSGRLLIVDVKTCDRADPTSVERSIVGYGYHQQAAHYIDAAVALDIHDDPAFLFVFVEKTPPHLVSVVQLDTEAIDVGRRLNRRARQVYRDCTATGVWPGYHPDTDIPLVGLPRWADRATEETF